MGGSGVNAGEEVVGCSGVNAGEEVVGGSGVNAGGEAVGSGEGEEAGGYSGGDEGTNMTSDSGGEGTDATSDSGVKGTDAHSDSDSFVIRSPPSMGRFPLASPESTPSSKSFLSSCPRTSSASSHSPQLLPLPASDASSSIHSPNASSPTQASSAPSTPQSASNPQSTSSAPNTTSAPISASRSPTTSFAAISQSPSPPPASQPSSPEPMDDSQYMDAQGFGSQNSPPGDTFLIVFCSLYLTCPMDLAGTLPPPASQPSSPPPPPAYNDTQYLEAQALGNFSDALLHIYFFICLCFLYFACPVDLSNATSTCDDNATRYKLNRKDWLPGAVIFECVHFITKPAPGRVAFVEDDWQGHFQEGDVSRIPAFSRYCRGKGAGIANLHYPPFRNPLERGVSAAREERSDYRGSPYF